MHSKQTIQAALAKVTAQIASSQPVDIGPLATEIDAMLQAFDNLDAEIKNLLTISTQSLHQRDLSTAIAQQMALEMSEIVVAHINKDAKARNTALDRFIEKRVVKQTGHPKSATPSNQKLH
jgi:hypothetical protein